MYPTNHYNDGDRQFFFPFLLGGLTGGAIASVSRPRPVFVQSPPQPYPPYPPHPYYPPRPGYNYSYQSSGYYPY